MRIPVFICLFCMSLITGYGQSVSPRQSAQSSESQEGVFQLKKMLASAQGNLKTSPARAIRESNKILRLAQDMITQAPGKPGNPAYDIKEIRRCEADTYILVGMAFQQMDNDSKAAKPYRRAFNISKEIGYKEGEQLAARRLEGMGKGKGLVATFNNILEKLEDEIGDEGSGNEVNEVKEGIETSNKFMWEKFADGAEKSGNYAKAIEYHKKAIRYYDPIADLEIINKKYLKIADLYSKIGDKSRSEEYIALASRNVDESNIEEANDAEDTNSYSPPPRTINSEEMLADTKEILEEHTSPPISEEEEKTQRERDRLFEKAESLARMGNFEASTRAYQQANALTDLLNNYKQERQADSLDNLGFLEQMMVDLERLEMEEINQKRQRIFLFITVGLLLFIAGLITYLFFTKKKSHKKLTNAYKELEDTHKELKSTQSILVSAEKMASLGQLTAGIAHEINNPVNFITGNIHPLINDFNDLIRILNAYEKAVKDQHLENRFELVEKLKKELDIPFITEEVMALLEGIEEGASRTTEIVKGLRTFARMDEEEPKEFDVHKGLNATIALLKNETEKIEIIRDYGVIPPIEGYPGKLNQVFMNILTNAIQAVSEGGWVHISTRQEQDLVEVRIQDTGKGMSKEIIERIFEPFFTTKDVGEGTGLGLSISLGIIEQHNGSIKVRSEEGHGTEVVIQLPLKYQG